MLAAAIRETAAVNDNVGEKLMAISLPLSALDSNAGISMPLTLPLHSQEALAVYLPSLEGEILRYGPNYTCGGMRFKQVSFFQI